MKTFRFFLFVFLALVAVPLTSCNDDDDTNIEPSRTQLLTAGQWTGAAIFVNGADWTQIFMSMKEPMDIKTWKLKFNTDGTYTIQGDWLDPSPFTGKWEFTNNEQSILFDKGDPDSETVQIRRLTSSELYLDMEVEDEEDGTKMDAEVRFRR